MLTDLRFALRSWRSNPGITAAVVLTLALGIGANTTMFGVLDTLLLRPPAYVRDAGRVRQLYLARDFGLGHAFTMSRASVPAYEDLRSVPAFQALAASSVARVSVGRGVGAQPADVSTVTASYFPLLGVRPAFGRFFDSTEDRLGAAPVAVVSYHYWRRQLHGDPGVLGRTLPIGRSEYAIVGVAPEGFTGEELTGPDVWLPLRTAAPDLNPAPALTSRDPNAYVSYEGDDGWVPRGRLAEDGVVPSHYESLREAHSPDYGRRMRPGREVVSEKTRPHVQRRAHCQSDGWARPGWARASIGRRSGTVKLPMPAALRMAAAARPF